MRLSLNEATRLLLSGKQLAWSKYGTHKNGSIALDKPEQRRLLEFLLDADSSKVAEGSETLFEGLLDAWQNDDYDPGIEKSEEDGEHGTQSWLLDRVEASGFGGLTVFDGQPFDFYIGGSNWCLEGQNGSGKTSLASAILWALTGKYSRGHDGPMDVPDHREDVKDNDGKKIGTWPPLAAYPTQVSDLARKAEVWVRLTFKAQNGETATAYRCMISPPSGPTQNEQQIDDRLNTAVRVAEISVLMPARLAWIGFGKSSDSLYDAVKQLTGLDQLADIADGCSAFGNANRRFMKYAKDQYIDKYVERFNENTAVASQLAERFDIKIPDNITLAAENAGEIIRRAAEEASKAAGTHLVILKSEIPATVDTATVEGRSAVKAAVNAARGLVSQATKSITLFQTWRAMTDAAADEKFADLPGVSEAAKSQLAEGLVWHERQTADNKLRLKALAAQSFLAVKDGDSNCPLCGSLLDDDKKRPLAAELEELKAAASVAERTIGDVCRGIHETIDAAVPSQIREHRVAIDAMDPPVAYRSAMHDTFVAAAPFDDLLTGISAFAAATIEVQAEALPRFTYPAFSSAAEEPESVLKLRREIHALERLIGLIGWWKAHRHAFVAAWGQLIGNQGADGSFQDESIEAKLAVLERALDNAQPLDDISRHLSKAELAQREWAQINAMQEARKAVAEALSPLKAMRHLVAAETSRTIAELSGTIGIICDRIRLRERLSYEESVVERKQVNVTGSFSPGMRIDAALVANTSWSRAILWSFIFALREETLNAMGFNPLPLVVLDDPQGTFDPRNKRKWAEELVRCAKMPRSDLLTSQLILMTHERSFYQMVIAYEKLDAQQGLIGGVDKTSGVVTIANGGELERAYNEANDNNDDAKAREYIRKVRVYCEDLLKFMLRGEGNEVPI